MEVEFYGEILEFPDDMPDAEIEAILAQEAANRGQQNGMQETQAQDPRQITPLSVGGEIASAANRNVMQGLDFLLPGAINAGLRLAGSEYQMPTFSGAFAQTPGAAGGFMPPGMARDAAVGFGGALPAAAGVAPVAGRNIASPVGALSEFLGLGSARPASVVAGSQVPLAPVGPGGTLPAPPPTARIEPSRRFDIDNMVLGGSEDVTRAGYRYDPLIGGAVVDDAARDAIKQGFPEDFIAMVEATNDSTRSKLRSMLEVQEGIKLNRRNAMTTRPLDVAGESLMERVNFLRGINKSAASQLDTVANSLKGKPVDVQGPVNEFLRELDSLGVGMNIDPRTGNVALNFDGSDIEQLEGPINIVKDIIKRMSQTRAPDAYDVHRLKRYIDEKIGYGVKLQGLTGNAKRIIKQLRHNLDNVLDQQFSEYNRVNTEYAQTRTALESLQDVAGSKTDLTAESASSAMGTLLRRVLSNAKSRDPLMDSMRLIEDTTQRYRRGGQGTAIVPYQEGMRGLLGQTPGADDDILTQIAFADELTRAFGTPATMSFQGEIGKGVERAMDYGLGQKTFSGMLAEAGRAGLEKARGINEENAMEALRKLLGVRN